MRPLYHICPPPRKAHSSQKTGCVSGSFFLIASSLSVRRSVAMVLTKAHRTEEKISRSHIPFFGWNEYNSLQTKEFWNFFYYFSLL